MFTTASPMARAKVVTTSKYRNALPPTRPIFRTSAMLAMPSTTVRKMTGPITIFTSFTKVSPTGFICFASAGSSTPSSTPNATANRTCAVRFRARRFMGC